MMLRPLCAASTSPTGSRTDVERIANAFVGSINSAGIDEFEGLSFPCYVLVPGAQGGLVVVESKRDLDSPGERVSLETRDLKITLAGQAALASVQFRPKGGDQWASGAIGLVCRGGVWGVQFIAFSPNRLLLDSDIDSIRALRHDFVRSMTPAGPMPFAGLLLPFVLADGRSGSLSLIEDPSDLPGGRQAASFTARNEQAVYADSLAIVVMDLVAPDEELTGVDTAALVCAKLAEGWQVVAVMAGPAPSDSPAPGRGMH